MKNAPVGLPTHSTKHSYTVPHRTPLLFLSNELPLSSTSARSWSGSLYGWLGRSVWRWVSGTTKH